MFHDARVENDVIGRVFNREGEHVRHHEIRPVAELFESASGQTDGVGVQIQQRFSESIVQNEAGRPQTTADFDDFAHPSAEGIDGILEIDLKIRRLQVLGDDIRRPQILELLVPHVLLSIHPMKLLFWPLFRKGILTYYSERITS
jgi:hypothetical protein